MQVIKAQIKGSDSVGVDPLIMELLAPLLRKGSAGILSLLRPNHSQHGVKVGNKQVAKAVDLNSFNGVAVNSNGGATLTKVVCDMLELLG